MSATGTVTALPAGWTEVVDDLQAETRALSEAMHQPRVTTAGACGLLNRLSRSTVWVHGQVDLPLLLAELAHCAPVPDLQVAEHLQLDVAALQAGGWTGGVPSHRLRAELPASCGTPVGRTARWEDLPALRALHARAFGDAEGYLPDLLLTLPGLQLRLLEDADGRPLATCGIRLRHRGAFVFGLATRPEEQGRGLGTALLRGCLRWAAEQGAPFALADVTGRVPGLWARAGFVTHGAWTRWTAPGTGA